MKAARILIVEDEFLVAAMIKTILKRADYAVAGISSTCASALNELDKGGIDAVTLDLSLSHAESSLPVAKALEARGIPYIIVSGYEGRLVAEHEGLSPAGIVGKPFPVATLLAAVAGCFDPLPSD